MVAAGARVTATDLNPAMVEYGSRQVPEAVWEQADAMRLPYPDGAFDLVIVQFGVMFLPDRPAGFAEARRVLLLARLGRGPITFAMSAHVIEAGV